LPELNLALLELLRNRRYSGRVAVAAASLHEVELYKQAGAQVILRPFIDAAEQATEALTHAMEMLPKNVNWPVDFQEIRVQPGTVFAGQTIQQLPLRALGTAANGQAQSVPSGVSILAVSRAGRVYYDPGPDFQIFPGDRLVLMGAPEGLKQAEHLLNQMQMDDTAQDPEHFVLAEVSVAALQFRQQHGVTVVGIQRGEEQVLMPGPTIKLAADDRLIVIGKQQTVDILKQLEPL
jgi:K+/H+ antiporter YhaU regulatory subunit KhtT